MTRAATFGFVIIATMLAGSTSGHAYYEGPWCMKAVTGIAEVNICHFRTIEHCLAERSLWGGAAFCGQNPRFPYWNEQNSPKRRKLQRELR